MVLKAIDPSNMDLSVSPAQDFYKFANGGWLNRNPIPAEYSRWGTFEELNESSMKQIRAILDECVADVQTTDANRKAVAIIYGTGTDEQACEAYGLSPLSDVFSAIDDVQTPGDIVRLSARFRSEMGVHGGLFAFYSLPDAKNSSWEVIALSQSTCLGIGDRDFYFREDKETIREKYVAHIANMMRLGGFCPGDEENEAQQMMELELKLAESSMTKTERRDPDKTYNKCNGVAELATRTSSDDVIPWADFFHTLGLDESALKTIIVDHPPFFETLATQLKETPLHVWKTYLRFHVMKSMANYVSPDVEEEHFSFFGTTMTGQEEMKPRWKRVLQSGISELIPHCLGVMYTKRHFPQAAKDACLQLVNVLIDVWRQRIQELDWMQSETKDKALQKLSKFKPLIGYPDKWETDDIPQLLDKISTDKSYAANVRACKVRKHRMIVERIDKPVDTGRWEMAPTTVNAYFHPLKNVIVFPAAILQPPFFFHPTPEEPYGDVAVNFSAIGAVICHEISHGYDDQGRKFNDKGELVDWWSGEDAEEYMRRAEKMEKLCSDYKVFGKNLNGKLCLGENIADYGGVKLAYRGLKYFQEQHGKLDPVDGYTPEQRFFIGWATVWRNNIREENALQRIIMDPHAPGEFRANIVQVVEEFHTAFDVREGDGMYRGPEECCQIW